MLADNVQSQVVWQASERATVQQDLTDYEWTQAIQNRVRTRVTVAILAGSKRTNHLTQSFHRAAHITDAWHRFYTCQGIGEWARYKGTSSRRELSSLR